MMQEASKRAFRIKDDGSLAEVEVLAEHDGMIGFRYVAGESRYGWASADKFISVEDAACLIANRDRARLMARRNAIAMKVQSLQRKVQDTMRMIDALNEEAVHIDELLAANQES